MINFKRIFTITLILTIIVLAINITIGFLFTHFNLVKKWYILPGINIKPELQNVSEIRPISDGPFVFFNDKKIQVKNLIISDSASLIKTDSFSTEMEPELFFAKQYFANGIKIKVQNNFSPKECEHKLPEKIFVVSDIEGQFDALWQLLIEVGVIDTSFNWIFGPNSLVINGDLVDRGPNVTECLWLVYKLWIQAPYFGGNVHYILGNHEIMLLQSDVRYVNQKYITNSDLMQIKYEELFYKSTLWGNWLRSLNIVEKIGKFIFVHGGIPPIFENYEISLQKMNFLANQIINNQKWENIFYQNDTNTIFIKQRPYWFRDYVQKEVSQNYCEKMLEYYQSETMIIGHTIVDQIKILYNGKIIAVDVDHAEGNIQGLLIENNKFYRIIPEREKEIINPENPV